MLSSKLWVQPDLPLSKETLPGVSALSLNSLTKNPFSRGGDALPFLKKFQIWTTCVSIKFQSLPSLQPGCHRKVSNRLKIKQSSDHFRFYFKIIFLQPKIGNHLSHTVNAYNGILADFKMLTGTYTNALGKTVGMNPYV